jgi:hypothetical protein
VVPNIWYNQTNSIRAEILRSRAKWEDEKADLHKKHPKISPKNLSALISNWRERACLYRNMADQIEAAGSSTHPVAHIGHDVLAHTSPEDPEAMLTPRPAAMRSRSAG